MSLSGLDDPSVIDAYQTALAEAGGWFLLKYASRDEVTLLGRGTGGVPELRTAVEAYEEISPLYGFLQYRRRKVVLKYVPEGTSRLLLARTTVQFQSILDKFSPQDTVFNFASSTELTESALSSACLLHAASASITSSNSSLRRRRLMEIAEDAEEGGQQPAEEKPAPPPPPKDERRRSQLSEATAVPPPQPPQTQESLRRPGTADSRSDAVSVKSTTRKRFLEQLAQPRKSSQSVRPSLQELDYAAPVQQKVKLGPRPSVDINGRPRTAGSLSRSQDQRPVAALPAGVRPRKSPNTAPRPKSHHDAPVPSLASLKNAPPVPLLIPPPTIGVSRPPLSPTAKSMTAVPSSGMTPEKQRLMKALELRKKQLEKRTEELRKKQEKQEEGIGATPKNLDAAGSVENTGTTDNAKTSDIQGSPSTQEQSTSNQTTPTLGLKAIDDSKGSPTPSKPDSAVEMGATLDSPSHPDANAAQETVESTSSQGQSTDRPGMPESRPPVQEEPTPEPAPEASASQPSEGSAATEIERTGTDTPHQQTAQGEPEPTGQPLHIEQEQDHTEPGELDADREHATPAEEPSSPQPKQSATVESTTQEGETPELPSGPTVQVTSEPEIKVEAPRPDTAQSTKSKEEHLEAKQRRIAMLEPIQVSTPEVSDEDNLLSDDSFMSELKTATVQEAKSVSMEKTPIASGSDHPQLDIGKNRSVSNPTNSAPASRSPSVQGRSVSANHAESSQQSRPLHMLVAKKVNVSSGISKRIKALERFSANRETSSTAAPSIPASSPASSAFDKFRRRASTSKDGSLSSTTQNSKTTSQTSTVPFPELPGAESRSRKNSVSVTARIVREPSNASTTDMPTDSGALNLQRSELIVEQTSNSVPSPQQDSVTASSPQLSRRGSVASRTSTRSKMEDKLASSPEEKSRAARLMRRMSSFTSQRKNTVSSTSSKDLAVAETHQEEESRPVLRQPIDIGEVNVQFPNTLLWKRRFLRIDDQGYLILMPSSSDSGSRNAVKRYHLSEFKTPCLPDEDRQELPNSIVLDFRNGSTLQCACESRKGQAAVLRTLVDAHTAFIH